MSRCTTFSIITALLFIPVLGIASETLSPQELSLLKRVRDFWSSGDISLAKQQICTYLSSHSEGDLVEELSMLLGDAYMQEGQFSSALQAYQQVHKPTLQKQISYNYALCLYEAKQTDAFVQFIETLPSLSLTNEQHTSLSYLSAECLMKEGKFEEAIRFAKRCEHSSLRIAALQMLGSLSQQLHRYRDAAAYYLTLSEEDKEQAQDYCFQAASLLSQDAPDQALALFIKLSALECPQRAAAAMRALTLFVNEQSWDLAINFYTEHQTILVDPMAAYLAGESFYAKKVYDKAYTLLSPYLSSGQDHLYIVLLDCLYAMKDSTIYAELLTQALQSTKHQELFLDAEYAYVQLLFANQER